MVDYAFYKYNFLGNAIGSAEIFDRLEIRAAAYIKSISCGISEVTDDVKAAVCAVCEVFNSTLGHEGISSENNDGYSVSYVGDLQKRLYEAAKMFLPSSLLYRGID